MIQKSPKFTMRPSIFAILWTYAMLRALRNKHFARKIDAAMGKRLRKHAQMLQSNESAIAEAKQLYAHTTYWHGTGRYQYDEQGKIVDVLAGIAAQGGLTGVVDYYDLVQMPKSLSLARTRLYARAYADMHLHHQTSAPRYGSTAFWANYFIASSIFAGMLEIKPWTPAGFRILRQYQTAKRPSWAAKVHSSKVPEVMAPFVLGSDIPGNYPIIIGVSQKIPLLSVSRAIGLHEVRAQNVPLQNYPHRSPRSLHGGHQTTLAPSTLARTGDFS